MRVIRTKGNPGRDIEQARRVFERGFSATARQRVANRIAVDGLKVLRATTAENIKSPRWLLSGMAFPEQSTNRVDMAWFISEVTPDEIAWRNPNPIFKFLDKGTRDHGPVRAKKLFIPLNKQTALAYLQKRLSGGMRQVKRKSGMGWKKLVWGKDFILKDWVRGIAARHILDQAMPQIRQAARQRIAEATEAVKMQLRRRGLVT